MEGNIEVLQFSIEFYGVQTWTLRKDTRSTWNVLKCGAGKGWIISVGSIM
jgi:hypothetical protein